MRSVNTCDVIQLPYRNRVFNNTSPRFRVHLTPHPDSSVTVNELLPVLSWCCLTHVVNLLIDSKVLNYFQYQIRGSKTQKGVKKVLCSYYFDTPALVKYNHQWNAPNKDKNHQNKKKHYYQVVLYTYNPLNNLFRISWIFPFPKKVWSIARCILF